MFDPTTAFGEIFVITVTAALLGVGAMTIHLRTEVARQDEKLKTIDDLKRQMEDLTSKYLELLRESERQKGRKD